MDSVITDALSSANCHVCRVSVARKAFLTIEAYGALATGGA